MFCACNFICLSITKLSFSSSLFNLFFFALAFHRAKEEEIRKRFYSLLFVESLSFCRKTSINFSKLKHIFDDIYDLIELNCRLINFLNFCTVRQHHRSIRSSLISFSAC